MFSIIIPVYNRQHTIKLAIDSVINQSFKDWELIVVDDCSTDESYSSVLEYTKFDDRIRLIRLPENKGAAGARNAGIQAATGTLISFLDSDDFFEKDFLIESYKEISKSGNNVGFMWTGYKLINGGSSKLGASEHIWRPPLKETTYITLLHNLYVGIGAGITLKKHVFNACGLFRQDLPAAEDTEFFLRISKYFDFTYSEKLLININRGGEDRLSKRYDKIYDAYKKFLPDYLPDIYKSRHLRLKFNYKMQWLSYYGENKKEAREYFFLILKDNPFHKNSWFVFLFYEIFGLSKGAKLHNLISRW